VTLPRCGGWVLIIRSLARALLAAFGLVFTGFAGFWCDGPTGVT
jgi:hypothetical protein